MKIDHRSLLGGETAGPLAASTRLALRMASLVYGAGARIRHFQYDTQRKNIHHAGVPVISVGNLTTGGTGKTPLVCDLCARLRRLGARVAIISRGYGAGESGVNDEALEMAQRLPDVPHVQHVDRVEAARIAVEELAAEVLVMDDGFQHRRLHRDLDLVVIDATCPFGFGYLLPRGYLREPISSLSRADAVILTRTDQVDRQTLDSIGKRVCQHIGDRPLLQTTHQPAFVHIDRGGTHPIDFLRDRTLALVSAIGNPDAFERTVRDCGSRIIGHEKLPDHDPYQRETRRRLTNRITELRRTETIDLVLCTHKDAVKLGTDQIGGVPLGHLQIDLVYSSEEQVIQDMLAKACEAETLIPHASSVKSK